MIKVPFLLVPVLLGLSAAANAEAPPDAGALLQQIEKNRQPALPKKSTQDVRIAPPPLEALSGPSVTVKHFQVDGNALLDDATLQRALAPFLDRPLSFQELQRAALAVSDAYRQAGWIARAYLPRQEIDGGTVTIQVVEAVFGGARVGAKVPARVSVARIQSFVEAAQPVGKPLNADALDRALLLIDDLPGVSASGNLAAGDRDNETVAVLKLEDEPLLAGTAGIDNTGSHSTGDWRASTDLFLNSPLKLGDALALDLIHSKGSDYGRVAYDLPVGSSGLRVGASASYLDYRLVTEDFAALRARGNSGTTGVDASYPLVRSRFSNLYLTVNYDDKRFDNLANGGTVSQYRIESWTAGLNGNLFDNVGGGGSSNASLAVEQGRLNLNGSPSQASDAATLRSAGSFTKWRYALSRQQAVTESISLYAALSGQQANRNLDSSEKFYLGGSAGVRAYPTSEAGGTNGQMVNLELRGRLPAGFTAAGFFDWGHVSVNRDNDFPGAAPVNGYALKGAGVQLGWLGGQGLSVKAALAHRIGNNPNPNIDGSDQDGTLKKNRLWLTANLTF